MGGGPVGTGTASGSLLLVPDASSEVTLYAGDMATRSLCNSGGVFAIPGGRTGVPPDQQPMVTWKVSARLVSFDGDTATMDVRWRRDLHGGDLEPGTSHEGEFRWTTAEGASSVLDLVRQAQPPEPRCETRFINMRFMVGGDLALLDAAIGYDVWLVQRLPSGATRTHHMHTTAQPGEDVPFFFPRVGIDVPGLGGTTGPPILDVGVQGRIRGRVRRDGRLDLSVDAGRGVGPRGVGSGSSTYGRTRLTVDPNETVEFEPPPHTGRWGTVMYADVFREARTAIRLRATRLW